MLNISKSDSGGRIPAEIGYAIYGIQSYHKMPGSESLEKCIPSGGFRSPQAFMF